MHSIEAIRAALQRIPSDIDRETWAKIAAAIKSELPGDDGFELFDSWSQGGQSYNAKDVKSTWRSIKSSGGVTIGTLFYHAKQNGFDMKEHAPQTEGSSAVRESLIRERAEREQKERAESARKRKSAADEALRQWGAASEQGSSPYLTRKQVGADGVRFAGGAVLVPLYDAEGALCNLQRIAPNGDKRFLTGGKVRGCMHWVGHAGGQAEAVLVAEGYATAWTLHAATCLPVAVAFNAGNLASVARAVRAKHPALRIIVCADDDAETQAKSGKNPGLEAAQSAAAMVDGVSLSPLGLLPGETDFNDLAVRIGGAEGLAEVARQFEAIKDAAAPAQAVTHDAYDDDVPREKGFHLLRTGLWFVGTGRDGEAARPLWICSALKVGAKTRDTEGEGWGRLLEFADDEGTPKRFAMPLRMLSGDGAELRSILYDMGLRISTKANARQLLTQYIQEQQPSRMARCTDRVGWHDAGVFVLPKMSLGADLEEVIFQSASSVPNVFKQAGEVAQWRENVASLCAGNSRLLFAVGCAFAAPLLHLAGLESGGFHFQGESADGKSTALRAAASVYGGSDYVQLWRTTSNALESIAAQTCDVLLVLDELGQVEPKQAGECAYMLSNGMGKARMGKNAAPRARQNWRLLFLSAGEIGLAQHMAEAGQNIRAGQEVRLAEVPSNAGKSLGAFDTLNGCSGGAELSQKVTAAAKKYYGAVGMAWLEWCVNKAVGDVESMRAQVSRYADAFCPEAAAGQVQRVAQRFALVGVAGEVATAAGLTGWLTGQSEWAARTCFNAWLERRGTHGNIEEKRMVDQVREWLTSNIESRFPPLHRAADDHRPNAVKLAGYREYTNGGDGVETDKDYYAAYGEKMHPDAANQMEYVFHVLPDAFNEACGHYDMKAVARRLRDLGHLEGSGGRLQFKKRLPGLGNQWVYRIKPSIFDTAE